MASAALRCRSPLVTTTRRSFHSSSVFMARRDSKETARARQVPFNLMDLEPPQTEDDTTVAGHLMLRQHRQLLYHMRLIEHEIPKLVAFRKPFVPPTPKTPVVVRSISYGGEEHPATLKRVIVVPVAHLPLKDDSARHSLKLIAGSRWTPTPPRDSGIGSDAPGGEHGYVKISCEDFPRPAMNLKWASDALDRLIEEANKSAGTLSDIPTDTRHISSKARKSKKGQHLRIRPGKRVTIRDFPQEWLPNPTPQTSVAIP
ncbi:mitochondrial ribosomal subunit protein-domain-containing protein [Thelephora terrestris]|uniref:Mitochondrial ribosomal subunit protein-domain-containing protein n=1 Tax=Thelephora terrestris TaxID=56493 RepID=A0A9P6HHU7_9AGAM|nr:mitochondrial ribosomal subunit protein-domain-containing protein [Thelephora terrestris]